MNKLMKAVTIGIVGLVACFVTGCRTAPGGIAPSSTPLEGRSYTVLGYTESTDSRICLFGILPVSNHNSIRDAVEDAQKRVNADALIDVTVEGYSQYYIIFSRDVTRVEGIGIRFTK
jgi:hypothetical protein